MTSASYPLLGGGDNAREIHWWQIAILLALPVMFLVGYKWYEMANAPTVSYHGGNTIFQTTVIPVFWLPPGRHFERGQASDRRYMTYVEDYFTHISGSRYLRILDEYDGPTKVSLGRPIIDRSPMPRAVSRSRPLSASDLISEVNNAAGNRLMGFTFVYDGGPSSQPIVFLFLPSHTFACVREGCDYTRGKGAKIWCGIHTDAMNLQSPTAVVDPDPNGRLCHSQHVMRLGPDPTAASAVITANHELLETLTDPDGDGWNGGHDREIVDLCPWKRNAVLVKLHGQPFVLGKVWSEQRHRCAGPPA